MVDECSDIIILWLILKNFPSDQCNYYKLEMHLNKHKWQTYYKILNISRSKSWNQATYMQAFTSRHTFRKQLPQIAVNHDIKIYQGYGIRYPKQQYGQWI